MAFEKTDRYASVEDLQADITAYQNGFATGAERAGLGKQLVLLIKRHKGVFGTAAAAWLVITALAVWFVIEITASERETRRQAEIATANEQIAEQNAHLAQANEQRVTRCASGIAQCGEVRNRGFFRPARCSAAGPGNDLGSMRRPLVPRGRSHRSIEDEGQSRLRSRSAAGQPLKLLEADGNNITDLRPLAGLPLRELSIQTNPIEDFTPLLELPRLEKLGISHFKLLKGSIEPLREHPTLQYIALADRTYRPVAEFWAEYDAQQAAKPK